MNIYQKLFLILIWITITLLSSYLVKKLNPLEEELSRKIVHIGTGPVIIMAWWFQVPKILAITASTIITIGLLLNYQFRLFPNIEDISRKSFGTIAYGLSITLLLIFCWPKYAPGVCLGILSMAFGDGFAGLIGQRIKSPSWIILGQKKSIAGTITIAILVSIIGFTISSISGIDIQLMKIISLAILATLLEQVGPYGIDNITVPIGTTYAWILLFGN